MGRAGLRGRARSRQGQPGPRGGVMKAFLTRSLSSLETLALNDVDAPQPGPGEIAIAVEVASLQLGDLALILGQRMPAPALPFTPGMEAAGTVIAVGKDAKGIKKGE